MSFELQTKRFILRDFQLSDWRSYHCYTNDREATKWENWGPLTSDEARSVVRNFVVRPSSQPRSHFYLAIESKATGELLGDISLIPTSGPSQQGEIGFMVSRKHWGIGIGSETAQEVLRFGFEDLHLRAIVAKLLPQNHRSMRLVQRLGMRPTERLCSSAEKPLTEYEISVTNWKN